MAIAALVILLAGSHSSRPTVAASAGDPPFRVFLLAAGDDQGMVRSAAPLAALADQIQAWQNLANGWAGTLNGVNSRYGEGGRRPGALRPVIGVRHAYRPAALRLRRCQRRPLR